MAETTFEPIQDSPEEQRDLELPQSIRRSRDYFLAGGDGISMDQLASECGFTASDLLAAHPEQQPRMGSI
jgi:hypothetical protein